MGVLQSGQESGAEVPAEFFQAPSERRIFAVALFDSVLYKYGPFHHDNKLLVAMVLIGNFKPSGKKKIGNLNCIHCLQVSLSFF